MTPTRRAQPHWTSVQAAGSLLAILLVVAACAPPAGGPGGSGVNLTGNETRQPLDRVHQQAQDALERWADAVRTSGGASITFVGDVTGQIGDWEEAVGENNKSALMAGLIEAATPLSDATPSRDKVRWLDGSEVDVNVLSAADTFDALVAAAAKDSACPDCTPLVITGAQLATGLVDTSRGAANAPAWVLSIEGTSVKVTRIAVDESVTVDPPPWNANDPPVGISIESATGSEDSKKLTVSFVGAVNGADQPCGADYTAEAVESDLAVVIILHEHRNPAEVACRAVGTTRTAKVTLDMPLGKRAVLEIKQGLPVSVVGP
jgi:hypothetical protein